MNRMCFHSSDEPLFDSDRAVEKTSLLLQYVLDCLNKIFLYDTQRFLSRERADALLSPLIDQVRAHLSCRGSVNTTLL